MKVLVSEDNYFTSFDGTDAQIKCGESIVTKILHTRDKVCRYVTSKFITSRNMLAIPIIGNVINVFEQKNFIVLQYPDHFDCIELDKHRTYKSPSGTAFACLRYKSGFIIPILENERILILYAQPGKEYIPNMLPIGMSGFVVNNSDAPKIKNDELIMNLVKIEGKEVKQYTIRYGLEENTGTSISSDGNDKYVNPRIISCNSKTAIYDQGCLYSMDGTEILNNLKGAYISTDCIVCASKDGSYHVMNSKETIIGNIKPYPR